MINFFSKHWKATLPDGWHGERDAECDSIYHSNGPGVLQVSSLLQDQPITDDDLTEFAKEHVESGVSLADSMAGDFTGITINYDVDELYWREWYLKAGNLFLFVTYHCALSDEGKEDDIIDHILETFQLINTE